MYGFARAWIHEVMWPVTDNEALPRRRGGQAAGRGGQAEEGAGQLWPVLLRGAGGPQVQLRPGGEEEPPAGGAAPRPGRQVRRQGQATRQLRQVASATLSMTEDVNLIDLFWKRMNGRWCLEFWGSYSEREEIHARFSIIYFPFLIWLFLVNNLCVFLVGFGCQYVECNFL